jgi:membrane protein required for colicin V production
VGGLSTLDWVLLSILVLSIVFSTLKGFTRELVSLAALIWGFLAACWYYSSVAPWILPHVRTQEVASLAAFLLILVAAVVVGAVLSHLAGKLVQKSGLRWFDRLLGASFGMLRGVLACVIVVLALAVFQVGEPMAQSKLAPVMVHAARVVVYAAPGDVRARFRSGFERAQKVWDVRADL